jgi:hypothetical protein
MSAQFPATTTTSTTLHRGPSHALLAALVALAVAGGTVGIVAAVNDDGNSTPSASPSVAQSAPDRVLDGSPILRGTADNAGVYPYRHAIAPASLRTPVAGESRVLDGSPILRGHVVTHVSSVQGTLRPPVGRPFGFRNVP